VNGLLKKYAKEALDSGLPIIRPLWMLDTGDSTCHTVVDEFSVGDELIVAPVIHEATTEREVYLPAGVWKVSFMYSLHPFYVWFISVVGTTLHLRKCYENPCFYYGPVLFFLGDF